MKTRMLMIALLGTVAFPAGAPAQSGAISGVQPVPGGQLQATFTASHSYCSSSGFCGWFAFASQAPAASPCNPSSLIWVSTEAPSTPGTLTETDTFYPLADESLRLCIYTHDIDNGDQLVGQALYTPPGSSSAATPPSSPASVAAVITIADARANIAALLRQKFGSRFRSHRNFKRDCYRLTSQKVRCRVRWDHGRWRYAGVVDMRNDPEDPDGTILYSTAIHRTRVHAGSSRPPHRPSGSPAPSHPSSSCDPSYKGACLKPNVSDYDCAGGSGDGPYYVQGPITVVGDDHYGLDRDGDGVACES